MKVMTWASELDRRVMDKAVAADPKHFVSKAIALVGLVYAVVLGGVLLIGTFTFSYADAATRVESLLLLPWSASPLALVLRGSRPRPVALLVLVTALGQYAFMMGTYGFELAYLPIALLGLTLLVSSRPTTLRRCRSQRASRVTDSLAPRPWRELACDELKCLVHSRTQRCQPVRRDAFRNSAPDRPVE